MESSLKRVEVSFTRVYQMVEHICPHCGEAFIGAKTKVYCSSQCASRAAWGRNGERYLRGKQQRKGCAL